MKLAQTNWSKPAETRPAVTPRLECGDRSPLSADATGRGVSKRGHVRAFHKVQTNLSDVGKAAVAFPLVLDDAQTAFGHAQLDFQPARVAVTDAQVSETAEWVSETPAQVCGTSAQASETSASVCETDVQVDLTAAQVGLTDECVSETDAPVGGRPAEMIFPPRVRTGS